MPDKAAHIPGTVAPLFPGTDFPSEPVVSKWRDLFDDNRSSTHCSKLTHFSGIDVSNYSMLFEDLDDSYNMWQYCIVGYVAGKSPIYKALQGIISSSWKCEATLSIHKFGWLIYKFSNIDDKMAVLCRGLYLVYGRPLLLRSMPEFFYFSTAEMTRVPASVKFPNLPLRCWNPRSFFENCQCDWEASAE